MYKKSIPNAMYTMPSENFICVFLKCFILIRNQYVQRHISIVDNYIWIRKNSLYDAKYYGCFVTIVEKSQSWMGNTKANIKKAVVFVVNRKYDPRRPVFRKTVKQGICFYNLYDSILLISRTRMQ